METWDIRSIDLEPHRPQVLSSHRETRMIAINLPGGDELQEHQTHERLLLLVIDGRVEIEHGDETATGEAGFVAVFDPAERREVRATDDSRLLLILAPWPGEGHPSRRD